MELIAITAFILDNWDTIGLIFTNIIALFMEPPFNWRLKNVKTK